MTTLHRISKASPGRLREDAIDLFLACHKRIRHFTEIAKKLGEDHAEPDLASAAAAVHRYFTVSLPLHAGDEDLLVTPILAPRANDLVLSASLDAMTAQHVEIEAAIDTLAPSWHALSLDPGRASSLAHTLGAGAAQLEMLFGRHLTMEELVIFPALRRCLSPAELAAMADEVRARRNTP